MSQKNKNRIVTEDLPALVPAADSQVVLQLPGLGAIPLAGFSLGPFRRASRGRAIQISLPTNQGSDPLAPLVQGQEFATGTIAVSAPGNSQSTVLSLSDVKVTEYWTVDPPEGGWKEIFTLTCSRAVRKKTSANKKLQRTLGASTPPSVDANPGPQRC
jgi:hypothetical protein